MGDRPAIGWTDATWNPTTGCTHVSPGCERCYAEALSRRRGWTSLPWTTQNARENVRLHPDRLEQPFRWRRSRRIFVDSMSDLLHELVPLSFAAKVLDVIADDRASHHVFQLLTKRIDRWAELMWFLGDQWPGDSPANVAMEVLGHVPNLWLGVSVEDQRRANERIPALSAARAAVRFVSCEPLLGPVDFWECGSRGPEDGDPFSFSALTGSDDGTETIPGIDWVIVGGETGRGYRVMEPHWLVGVVEQARVVGVPVFVKQDSGSYPGRQGRIPDDLWALKQFPEPRRRT